MSASVIDDAPMRPFHWRVAALSAGGPFLDGWVLSIIAIVLIQATPALEMSDLELALVGSAALAGMLLGGLFGGYLCDRFGRKITYTIDLTALVVGSILCALVGAPWQLVVLRFLIGIAVGADYPIATSLLAEFVPRRRRGVLLASLVTAWFLGACLSYLVGFALSGLGEDAWRWMLASAALPGLIIVLLRVGIPESPRWLLNRGRAEDASVVLKKVFGPKAELSDMDEPAATASMWDVLRNQQYRTRLLFVVAFQSAQIVPLYAIYTFLPVMLTGFGFDEGDTSYLGGIVSSSIVLVGSVIGMFLMDKWGRRPVLILPFVPMAGALFLLAFVPPDSIWPVVVGFAVYSFFSGITGLLVWSYPSELFPTEIRSTALGFVTAFTRIAAAVGTFLVPLTIAGIGIGGAMFVGAVITVLGLVVSVVWAPETRGRTLAETSALTEPSAKRARQDPLR